MPGKKCQLESASGIGRKATGWVALERCCWPGAQQHGVSAGVAGYEVKDRCVVRAGGGTASPGAW